MLKLDLKGKIAVVTGATGQLGRVMVKTLAECDCAVAVHYYQNAPKAHELVQELERMGGRAMAVQCDVAELDDVFRMRNEIVGVLGAPDIVVNNAVVQYQWKPVLEQETADYVSQFRSCVLHNVNMAKAFVPAMVEKKYGRFIGINTECSMQLLPTQSAYVAGKRGMDGVLKVLAREVGQYQITVNEVAPGWTVSEQDREQHTERDSAYESHVALARRGTDQEIANAVAFLASDLASFITGVYLPVCGGYIMPCI